MGKLVSEGITNSVSSGWIEKEKERLTKIGGVFLLGDQVSKYLKELSDPPLGLYCLGEIPIFLAYRSSVQESLQIMEKKWPE